MTSTTDARLGPTVIRVLVLINLGLLALEVVAAGLVLSGSGPAVIVHARGALGLGLGAIIQAIVAVVLWARGRVPAWVARAAIVLFVIVVLQMGAGHRKLYWLHVPIAFGLFGWLLRQTRQLDALRAARPPS
jgi:hypothetical protein